MCGVEGDKPGFAVSVNIACWEGGREGEVERGHCFSEIVIEMTTKQSIVFVQYSGLVSTL